MDRWFGLIISVRSHQHGIVHTQAQVGPLAKYSSINLSLSLYIYISLDTKLAKSSSVSFLRPKILGF